MRQCACELEQAWPCVGSLSRGGASTNRRVNLLGQLGFLLRTEAHRIRLASWTSITWHAWESTMTNATPWLIALVVAMICVSRVAAAERDDSKQAEKPKQWRALHLLGYNTDGDLEKLGCQ